MIPLTFLYDEYIDRPKLTEQKNPFEYIVPPPTSGSEQKSKYIIFNIKIHFRVNCVHLTQLHRNQCDKIYDFLRILTKTGSILSKKAQNFKSYFFNLN